MIGYTKSFDLYVIVTKDGDRPYCAVRPPSEALMIRADADGWEVHRIRCTMLDGVMHVSDARITKSVIVERLLP